MKRQFLQIAALVVVALILAVATNAMASRQRRLVLPGYYPGALRVPPKTPPVTAPPVAATSTQPALVPPAAATTTEMSPAPGNPPITIPTATIERPAGTPSTSSSGGATSTAPAAAKPAPAVAEDPLKRFPPHPDKPYVEIGGDDAAWLYAQGALFLDARRTSVYEPGHIAGSRPFSVWEGDIDDKVNRLFEERGDPQEQLQPIVVYCSGGACEDSHMLAQKLWGIAFNNVYVYKDGFPDWQKRGGAVKTGTAP